VVDQPWKVPISTTVSGRVPGQQEPGDLRLEVVELGFQRGRRREQFPLLLADPVEVVGVGAVEPDDVIDVDAPVHARSVRDRSWSVMAR